MTRPARALVASLLLLAAACGGDDASTSSLAPTTSATTSTSTSVAPTSTTSAPTTTQRKPRRTTTTLPELPTPIAPPPPGTVEPEVVVGTIEIPKIELATALYSGITLHTLDKGPGHWPGSAVPGQWGNAVVAGHRTSHDHFFRRLDELVPGDEIIYTTPEGRFVYSVTSTEIVDPNALWIVDQTYDHTTTLFACHPPGSTTYRIVVHGQMTDA